MQIDGDTLPEDVDQIPIRPVWQLGDDEERRTRQTEIAFRTTDLGASSAVAGSTPVPSREVATSDEAPTSVSRGGQTIPTEPGRTTQLSRLLDRRSGVSWIGLVLIAAGLGAIHSIQPGHGKTLVSAIALQPEARWYQPALLGLVTTLAHTGSVLGDRRAPLVDRSVAGGRAAPGIDASGRFCHSRGRILEDRSISGRVGRTRGRRQDRRRSPCRLPAW